MNEASVEPARAPEEPSSAAFGLLSRAQALADGLRSEVEAEVAVLRAEALAAHDEAKTLHAAATSVHNDALSAQRSALARLQEARDEAAQLVADAADQATLVADAADQTSDELLARSTAEAEEIRHAARTEDQRLRLLATTELEHARAQIIQLQSESAAILASRQSQVSAELLRLSEEAIQEAASDFTTARVFFDTSVTLNPYRLEHWDMTLNVCEVDATVGT